jgi:MFS family permease
MDTGVTYSLEECINYIGLGRFQWRLITILGFCSMADAVEMMLLAILGPALTCYWPNVTEIQIASLTTGVFAGMMCGAFLFGIIADKYGRRRVIVTSAILNTLFGIFTAFAPSYYWILLARTLVGFALSGAAQGSTLMLEYLPSSSRATIIIMIELFWSLGGIFEYLMAMYIVPAYGWRLLTILSALPISIVAACMYFIPESPRYYLASGRQEHAEHILKKIAMTNKRSLPHGKLLDVNARDECGSIKQLFHINFKRTSFLLAFMWMTVAMSYYGLILINTSLMTIMNDNPTTTIDSSTMKSAQCKMLTTEDYKSLIFTTFGEMFGIPLLLLLLSRFGRRTVCMINFTAASFCFTLFLLIPRNQPWIVNVITFIARMFITSQFSLMYLYTMEVYPTVIRAIAVGCASSMARIGAMITPYLAQVLIKQTFYGTIGVYIFATGLAALFAYLLPIETKGRELKQATFDRNTPLTTVNNDAPASSTVKNGITNNGYEIMTEDETRGEK